MLMMVVSAVALALSLLPATQPGLGPDEGVFLVTDADDGGQATYFIAQGVRHAILPADLQAELQINPLWPSRPASRDEVLGFPEAAPIGKAVAGRISQPEDAAVAEVPAEDDAAAPAENDATVIAEDSPAVTYTVKRGDTLLGIAARFGLTEADLLAANHLPNRNRIYAGQVLTLN